MCCLFGLLDYEHRLSGRKKSILLQALAVASEARGTDATGYAFLGRKRIEIYKQALPAHLMRIRVPATAGSIIGHTRMATQGDARLARNNHPFRGNLPGTTFALAHNGVIWNDAKLREDNALPATDIQTDSYIAVQLIEAQKELSFQSLRTMAEKLRGSYTLTLLDQKDSIWFVRGNNPMTIVDCYEYGFYLYASTSEILERSLLRLGLEDIKRQELPIQNGDILRIDSDGLVAKERFQSISESPWGFAGPYSWELGWETVYSDDHYADSYRNELVEYARHSGMPEAELQLLLKMELDDMDLEMAILDDEFRRECLDEFCADYEYMRKEDDDGSLADQTQSGAEDDRDRGYA